MDENQTNTGFSSDSGQTSGGEGGTSAKAPRTYTEKEYSDALAQAGRQAVERIKTEMQTQLEALQSQLDERDEAGIDKNNPDALTNFQLKKQIRDLKNRVANLEGENTQLKGDAAKGREYEQLEGVRKIAERYENIELADLKGKTEEEAESFCKRYGKPKEGIQPSGKPDSGVTSGGGTNVDKLSPAEKIEMGLKKKMK